MAKKKTKTDFDKQAKAVVENPFDDFDMSSEVTFSLSLNNF
jgi:hypothetical protein